MSNAENRPDDAAAQALAAVYYANPAGRLGLMRALFNGAAAHYDRVNLIFSLGTGAWYRRFCLRRAGVGPGAMVVDIATGTGLLAREAVSLAGSTGTVIGVDVSEAMLAIARRNLGIPLVQSAAEALPLASGIADFVTMGYGLRHVADLRAALAEARRILRPGGCLVLIEFSAPRHPLPRALAAGGIGVIVPLLSWFITRDRRARALMQYHWRTILDCMPPEAVLSVLRDAGFDAVKVKSYVDFCHDFTGIKPQAA